MAFGALNGEGGPKVTDYRGRFLWYELLASDPKAAKEFYTKVIGWGLQDFPGAPMPYTMWTLGERPVGGVMELPEDAKKAGAPPCWIAYVGVPDVDASLKDAEKRGARRHMDPFDVPEVGRMCVLADPQGATIAIYAASNDPGPETPPEMGDCSWHELATTDVEGACAFYAALFGWKKLEAHDMGHDVGVYQLFGRGDGPPLGGIFRKPANVPVSNWMLYFRQPEINAGAERVKKAGGRILNGPMEVPGGDWIVTAADPQGAAFSLHQLKG
jgi:predicted enzyme related to lactoylglutathione lyase